MSDIDTDDYDYIGELEIDIEKQVYYNLLAKLYTLSSGLAWLGWIPLVGDAYMYHIEKTVREMENAFLTMVNYGLSGYTIG